MKNIFWALVATLLLNTSVKAEEYAGRVLAATCNTQFGIGEIKFELLINDDALMLLDLNVVNSDLCQKGANGPSALVQLAIHNLQSDRLKGQVFQRIIVQEKSGIVTDIQNNTALNSIEIK